jgi:LEA14-like dessication related protein
MLSSYDPLLYNFILPFQCLIDGRQIITYIVHYAPVHDTCNITINCAKKQAFSHCFEGRRQGKNACFGGDSADIGYMRKLPGFLGVFFLLMACKSAPQGGEPEPHPAAPGSPVEVKEPTFTITSITILQADLINTRLKLSMRIDNPNTFPITLSSFRYELYGDGRFWTDGVEKNLAVVPAAGFAETSFDFDMNFIGMKRRLLDDIIAMREVRYRITGSMEMKTDIPELPGSRITFDYSGNSSVLE